MRLHIITYASCIPLLINMTYIYIYYVNILLHTCKKPALLFYVKSLLINENKDVNRFFWLILVVCLNIKFDISCRLI
jgi:hypothetical protein